MDKKSYKQALEDARKELGELIAEDLERHERIAKLRQTIGSLAILCDEEPFPEPGQIGVGPSDYYNSLLQSTRAVGEMKLTDACREVLRAASGQALTAEEVKDGLVRIGYDVSQQNILASIHTTLRRMPDVIETIKDEKKAYQLDVSPLVQYFKKIRQHTEHTLDVMSPGIRSTKKEKK